MRPNMMEANGCIFEYFQVLQYHYLSLTLQAHSLLSAIVITHSARNWLHAQAEVRLISQIVVEMCRKQYRSALKNE